MNAIRRAVLLVFASSLVVALPASVLGIPQENETFGMAPFPERADGLDRNTFQIPLEPGSTFEDAVRVYNRTDENLNLEMYATDAEFGLDGSSRVGSRRSEPKGVGAWISLSEDNVTLPPRGEKIVHFTVFVETAEPSPKFGAVVVENTARGLSNDLAKRLHVMVRTSPANSPTSSKRVRPLLLQSPWIIVAIFGLLVAAILVVLGSRRARKPQDAVMAPGEPAEPADVPEASRPVLHRLGEAARSVRTRKAKVPDVASKDEPESDPDEARPLLDHLPSAREESFIDTKTQDLDEELLPITFTDDIGPVVVQRASTRRASVKRKAAPRKPKAPTKTRNATASKDRDYIPLDEL